MAALTVQDVERIAALAHLELTDEEKLLYARQLASVLDYAQQVQEVDTSGVPATAHVLALAGVERDDVQGSMFTPEEATAQAPDAAATAGLFRVPRVIGG